MGGKGAMQPLGGGTPKDRKVLAEIVNVLQKRNISGTKGSWKEFLVKSPDVPSGRHDPFLCKRWILTSFLETITNKQDILMVGKLYSRIQTKHRMEEELEETNGSPEMKLVQLTWAHPRFLEDYNFDACSEGWIQIDGEMSVCGSAPLNLLSLDCEMVDCEGGTSEVVHVSLVDRTLKTRIDTRVRPSRRVVDYKSHITGVTAKDLDSVTVTQADVQKQVKELLTPGTIIVGHSLHHDLKALKIDYRRLIDTQYIFSADNGRRPGLRDLCKAVLGYDFRENGEPHNCLEDATIPMKLVLHRLQHGTSKLKLNEVEEGLLSKLLVHKIPTVLTADDLRSLFSDFSCQIQDVDKEGKKAGEEARGKRSYSSKYVSFENKDDANDAFSRLSGGLQKDISGRPQKRVSLTLKNGPGRKGKWAIMVRKMAFEDNSDTQQEQQKTTESPTKRKLEPNTTTTSRAPDADLVMIERSRPAKKSSRPMNEQEPKKFGRSLEQYAKSLGVKP